MMGFIRYNRFSQALTFICVQRTDGSYSEQDSSGDNVSDSDLSYNITHNLIKEELE